MGLFMAFQYPVAIPGVTITKYLRMVMNAHREARGEEEIPLKEFRKTVEEAMELTDVPREFTTRYLNEGFSGGEKKRLEILQLALQQPRSPSSTRPTRASTSTRSTSSPRRQHGRRRSDMGVLIITHYQRILHLVQPHRVSIMFEGRIVKEGGPELVDAARARGLRLDPRGGRRRRPDGPPRRHRARRGVPGPRPRGPRLPRQLGDVADAARRPRGDGRLLRSTTARRCTAASTRWPPRRPSCSRAPASASPRS